MAERKRRFLEDTELHARLPLFFQPWWLDTVADHWDVALAETEGAIQAVFPFQIEKKWGLRLCRNPRLTPYLGPLLLSLPEKDRLRWKTEAALIDELLKQIPACDYLQLTTLPSFQNFLPFHHAGFVNSAKLTYRLNLADTNDLFTTLDGRLRNTMRRVGQDVFIEKSEPDVHLFTQWHRAAFDRRKSYYPYSVSFFRQLFQRAADRGQGQLLAARDTKGQLLGMQWAAWDRTVTYNLLSAYNPQDYRNGVSDLLLWTAIQNARERGSLIFDFEGSMDQGIERFFRKYGGQRHTYFTFSRTNSLLWRLRQNIWR